MEVDRTWLVVIEVFAVVMTVVTVAVTVGFLLLVRKMSKLLDLIVKGTEPVIRQLGQASRAINETALSVTERAQRAAEVAEVKVAQAASQLEAASASIRKAAEGPAGSVGAVLTGLGQGLLSARREPRQGEKRDG